MSLVLRTLRPIALDPVFVLDSGVVQNDLKCSGAVGVRATGILSQFRKKPFPPNLLPERLASDGLRLSTLLPDLNLVVLRLWQRNNL